MYRALPTEFFCLFPASSYDLTAERGLSQFHQKHRLTTSILYELPLKFENNVAEAIAGGWQINGILRMSTGQFIDLVVSPQDAALAHLISTGAGARSPV